MRFRSEWVTVLTLTGLAVYMMTMTKPPAPHGEGPQASALGVDHTPVGTTRNIRRKPTPAAHP